MDRAGPVARKRYIQQVTLCVRRWLDILETTIEYCSCDKQTDKHHIIYRLLVNRGSDRADRIVALARVLVKWALCGLGTIAAYF